MSSISFALKWAEPMTGQAHVARRKLAVWK
jgi:hypothetical protein